MRRTLALLAISACVAAVAGSPAAQPTRQACFLARNVDTFAPVDDTTVNVRAGVGQVYQLKLFSPCIDLDFSQRIALRTRGSSWVCEGQANSVDLITPSVAIRQRCSVTSVRKLTPAEIAGLPRAQRP
jgi:hypothetical protein